MSGKLDKIYHVKNFRGLALTFFKSHKLANRSLENIEGGSRSVYNNNGPVVYLIAAGIMLLTMTVLS